MKQFMFATEFSEMTGYPLANIRKMAHSGILPHQKCGRKYLLHVPTVIEILKIKVVGEDTREAVVTSKLQVAQQERKRILKEKARNANKKGFIAALDALLVPDPDLDLRAIQPWKYREEIEPC